MAKISTKKALVLSMLSMLLCISMLVGSTFAWFTDTASTAVNKIQAGTLDVELWHATNDEALGNDALKWVKAAGHEDDAVLWEPGCTYNLESFRIKNNGNLALKYKVIISGLVGDAKLLEAIDFTVSVDGTALVAKDGTSTVSTVADLNNFEGTLEADAVTGKITITGHMKEEAGNEYQDLTIDGIAITVVATQLNSEYDSYDNEYDANAYYPTYPTGVTTASFPESVSDTTATGTITVPATAAYVDSNGDVKYVADVTDAIAAGAKTIYLKENETVKLSDPMATNRTSDLTGNLTIYANGADFQDGQVSVNMTDAGKAANITVKIVDAKNIYVWGASPNEGVTQTVILENCHNEGNSATDSNARMFYITGETGTVNVTLRNCSVTKAEAPVYMNCNGSVTVENCSFSECASAMKLSLKATSGTTAVTVSDTTFDKCGWTEYDSNKTYLTEDSSSIKIKTKSSAGATLTLNNVKITNVVGSNSIVVDGDTGYTGTTTVNATDVTVDGTAWTNS